MKGQTQGASPFHRGEQEIQARLGIHDKMENIGRRFIREYLLDQHQEFYQQLPFVLVGSSDSRGRLWASILTGKPGFVSSPDSMTLDLKAQPLPGDRLSDNLQENADIGLLGIELETRRRNRVNGKIKAVSADGFTVSVSQSFGNCPQYIQKRQLHWLPEYCSASLSAQRFTQLTPPLSALMTRADTLFIATGYTDAAAAHHGIDVSHRGGKPGFVRIEDDHTFSFPDFAGNNFYNTLGNLLLNDRVGILFLDFQAGHLLSVTGGAEIIWAGEAVKAFPGAERLLRITIDQMIYLPAALPFRWDFQEYSPSLEFTGQWSK
ncbi:MAG: flavin-nucleotide-binding protein [Leptolyngbyaceae cyanobacterium SM1_1_3]|nr:flavin-nucleotide-binding protein [Leptolyngbyaceae cyanobacterium SM1_1_3]NJN01451.1 flavin-nucleotide-binding protein [Leptolyngbyaceae cyanobacterium RM1_1_2]NJO10795.1 flavin-nucleotide-binding protein [Leptolyngbyaceae cyanobacterium SL_1_1]